MQKINRKGEIGFSISGQKMEIIEYNHANDITVRFEDGTIVKNKRYSHFKEHNIKNPNSNINMKNERAKEKHYGEKSINNSGLQMTIIAYRTNKDCDVQFEDGVIVRNRYYTAFKRGNIAHPSINDKNARKYLIGDTTVALNGMKMTIVNYSSNAPGFVEIEFEDGYRTIASSGAFVKGEVKNPNVPRIQKTANERIGQTFFCKNGLSFTITNYLGTHKVSGIFEDGESINRTSWSSIKDGTISHPSLSANKRSVYKNISAKRAWSEDDKTYYTCRCNKCNEEGIWTPQEMIEHEKECSISREENK